MKRERIPKVSHPLGIFSKSIPKMAFLLMKYQMKPWVCA